MIVLLGLTAGVFADAIDSRPTREEKLKAAFIYNFIKFVDRADKEKTEKEKKEDKPEPIIIGITGDRGFVEAFDPMKKKKIGNRNIIIKYFKIPEKKKSEDKKDPDFEDAINNLKKCTVVAFCTCQETSTVDLGEIFKAMDGSPVLTIGETENFLESGGIINFVTEKKKLKFDINLIAAEKAKLRFRAQLLKLARKVIQKKDGSDKNAKDN